MPPLPTLVCKQCGYVNEGERVYCHGCGAKLDREVIAAREQEKIPSPEEKQKEVKRMMNPRRGGGARWMAALVRLLVLAALVAVVVTAGHAPEDAVPLDAKKDLVDTPALDDLVEHLSGMPSTQRRALGEKEVSLFLRNERFRKVPSWFMDTLPLKRVYVNFEEGQARLTVGGTLLGWPLYAGWTGYFQPGGGGALEPVCNGAFIGRLAIAPKLARYTVGAVPLVIASADRYAKLIAKLESVSFSKGQAIFTTRPAVVAAPAAPVVAAPSAPAAAKPSASAPKPAPSGAKPSPGALAKPSPSMQGGFR